MVLHKGWRFVKGVSSSGVVFYPVMFHQEWCFVRGGDNKGGASFHCTQKYLMNSTVKQILDKVFIAVFL